MKSTVQLSKSMSTSFVSAKIKKSTKDKEKRKSQSGLIDSNSKGSPAKVGYNNFRIMYSLNTVEFQDSKQYAGISSDSICIYAEQSTYEHLSEDVCNILTEDINYKLRYIIHV